MKGVMLEDFDYQEGKFTYQKGQNVEVFESVRAVFNYGTYQNGVLDWIPKSMVKIDHEGNVFNGI